MITIEFNDIGSLLIAGAMGAFLYVTDGVQNPAPVERYSGNAVAIQMDNSRPERKDRDDDKKYMGADSAIVSRRRLLEKDDGTGFLDGLTGPDGNAKKPYDAR